MEPDEPPTGPTVEPVDPEAPEPDVNDGETAEPLPGDDDPPMFGGGQYGPTADFGDDDEPLT